MGGGSAWAATVVAKSVQTLRSSSWEDLSSAVLSGRATYVEHKTNCYEKLYPRGKKNSSYKWPEINI